MYKAGIYKIQNNVTGKVYIGCSYNIEKRWKSHLYMLRKGTHHSTKLQNSWDMYGEESFKFEILEEVALSTDKQVLFELEEDLIDEYDSFFGGYNCRISSAGVVYEADWLLEFKELSAKVEEPLKVVVWYCGDSFIVTLTEGEDYYQVNSGTFHLRHVNEKHFAGLVWEPLMVAGVDENSGKRLYEDFTKLFSLDLKTITSILRMALEKT